MRSFRPVAVAILFTACFALALAAAAQAGNDPESAGPDETNAPGDQSALVINEFMASNVSSLEDPDEPGEHPDWIELYNPSSQAISLNGLYWANGDPSDPARFPISNGLTIPAHGFLVFYADNDPRQGPRHLDFALDNAGEFLGLYGGEGGEIAIDTRAFGPQQEDVSEGRDPDGADAWRKFDRPTPGGTNRPTSPFIAEVSHAPQLPSAAHDVAVTAVISDDKPGVQATLYYSVNGAGRVALPMVSLGGSRFGAELPGQPQGAVVRYTIRARDSDGRADVSPRSRAMPSYVYQVGYVKPPLVISELMAANKHTLEDPNDPGDMPDWVELHNTGRVVLSLDGLYLTDDMQEPTKYAIPAGIRIPAGGYVIFYADDDPEQGRFHTNFKLNKDGDSLTILGVFGSVQIDRVNYRSLGEDLSYGRYPDASGLLQVMYCPTPGEANEPCANKAYLPVVVR